MKIVINRDFGGFGLSPAALTRYAELKGYNIIEWDFTLKSDDDSEWKMRFMHPTYSGKYEDMTDDDKEGIISHYDIFRADPLLVQVVEEMGENANDRFAQLKVVEIPDDVEWIIEEYDGLEHIAEAHRIWR
jgi:hypothetical protein